MAAYYNEIDPYAAQWLRNLIAAGHISPGEVDERSIVDVHADDLKGFTQCHFFAGIGGWSLAARLAGYADERELWTGSCPCQPFSVAGKGEGKSDERHLWPIFFALISSRRPDVVMGEQVAAAVGKDWLDGVHSDLESIGYAWGASVVPACAVDAPHRRDRLWFVANSGKKRCNGFNPLLRENIPGRNSSEVHETSGGGSGHVANTSLGRCSGSSQREDQQSRGTKAIRSGEGDVEHSSQRRHGDEDKVLLTRWIGPLDNGGGSAWSHSEWREGADGKSRRVEPSIRLLAHGVPARVGKLRAYGNAIVPQVAAEVIGAYLDSIAL